MIYKVIGLMSGTSLDGVDLVFCVFEKKEGWEFEVLASKTFKYPESWMEILKNFNSSNRDHIETLNKELGLYYAQLITLFCDSNQIIPDFISSHGHTIFHQPEKGITLQIGSGRVIAQKLRTTTINNFREKDVKMGGQGAPLVPIGDELLFGDYDSCLNLGGFANISFSMGNKRIAFDICPMNMALNYLSNFIDLDFDNRGEIARSGEIDTALLRQLNGLNYYAMDSPKSLGREWFESKFKTVLKKVKLSIPDKLATVTEHFAFQISDVINQNSQSNVLVTGGGAYNEFLIERLEEKTHANLIIPDPELIEFKEAIIFGFLGVLRIRNEINVLSSVTGAPKDHCAGVIHNP